jgi:hypothetical protein
MLAVMIAAAIAVFFVTPCGCRRQCRDAAT